MKLKKMVVCSFLCIAVTNSVLAKNLVYCPSVSLARTDGPLTLVVSVGPNLLQGWSSVDAGFMPSGAVTTKHTQCNLVIEQFAFDHPITTNQEYNSIVCVYQCKTLDGSHRVIAKPILVKTPTGYSKITIPQGSAGWQPIKGAGGAYGGRCLNINGEKPQDCPLEVK